MVLIKCSLQSPLDEMNRVFGMAHLQRHAQGISLFADFYPDSSINAAALLTL